MNKDKTKGIVVFILITVLLFSGIYYLMNSTTDNSDEYNYGQIMQYFDDLKVKHYDFNLNNGQLDMVVVNDDGTEQEISYTVPNVSLFVQEVINEKDGYRQKYNEAHPDAPLSYSYEAIHDNSFLISLIPTVLIAGLLIFMFIFSMKQAGGGQIGNFSKSKARINVNAAKKATFADVAGADEEKEELHEIVDFLKDNSKYIQIGARIPKGVLLVGPPGTGKTLLARAVAGEAGVPFYSISGSDFVEMFVGVGAARVRDMFQQAKKAAPAIIFIDEIDAVGRQRGTGLGGGHDEREQTLNQLLVEMDGFTGNEGVIVMAATNRRDVLDPALLRAGRFDRQIYVNYPDVKGREEILKVHTRNKPLAPDVDLKTVAKTTVGFVGADLENLVNEAGLLAARKNKKAISKEEMDEAAIKVVAGPEKKSKIVSEEERKLTAYHEGGHAICTYFCEPNEKVHQVTIIPRGMAGGFTMSLPVEDRSFRSKNSMKHQITILLGGRVAEKLILDDVSTGASNDLERATSIARSMVTRYGFSEKLGPVVYGNDDHEVFLGRDFNSNRNYSENVAAEIDSELRSLIDDGYQSAEDILTAHMDKLHLVAKYLLKYEKIDSDDFDKLMKGELTEADLEKSDDNEKADETTSEENKSNEDNGN